MEGIWETSTEVPMLLFAIPYEETRSNKYAIEIPYLASVILKHDPQGELQGLNNFKGEHPPVKPVFFGFRIMVGVGLLMILVAWWCGITLKRKQALSKLQLRVLLGMTFSGWIATLAGWYVTEIGRQPYLVSGVLKTADAVTTIASENVVFTFALYLCVYIVLLIAYIKTLFLLARKSVLVEEYDMTVPGMPDTLNNLRTTSVEV